MSKYIVMVVTVILIVLFSVHMSLHKPVYAQSPWVDSVQCPTDAMLIENGEIIFTWLPEIWVIEIEEPGIVCEEVWRNR